MTWVCFCVTAESHLGTTLSVGRSVGPNTKFDTKFQRKIQHKMDTIANAVTQLGVPALVLGDSYSPLFTGLSGASACVRASARDYVLENLQSLK